MQCKKEEELFPGIPSSHTKLLNMFKEKKSLNDTIVPIIIETNARRDYFIVDFSENYA